MKVEVFEMTLPDGDGAPPRGLFLVGLSEDGVLFINSEIVGVDPHQALLCCAHDATRFVRHGSKVLVPVEWAMDEVPGLRQELVGAAASWRKRIAAVIASES